MRRAAELAIVLAAALGAAVAAAYADDADEPMPSAATAAALPLVAPPPGAAPGSVAAQLDAQRAAAARAHEQVDAKRVVADATRTARVRAAYKLLRNAGSPLGVTPERRLAVARSRATARLLLARDRAESAQLTEETALLAAAVARIDRDRVAAATLVAPAPASLLRPVAGEIARRFGTLVHERSKATLSRRGLDFDVAADAPVVAPADGVVRYAGPIRGLDDGVVIDHGGPGGVLTVIAKLAPVALVPGARVTRGAVIGRPARRRVYFEVRLPLGPGGTPVDPEPLIAAPAPATHQP